MNNNEEILDAIEILVNKAIEDNSTKIQNGTVSSVSTNNKCTLFVNGKDLPNVQYYGGQPIINRQYRVFIPNGNPSRAFIIVPEERQDFFKDLGYEPIKSTADDTTIKWGSLGNGSSFYGHTGIINDQPSQYGFLINYVYGSDVFQLWNIQATGGVYRRSGNSAGWSGTWVRIG